MVNKQLEQCRFFASVQYFYILSGIRAINPDIRFKLVTDIGQNYFHGSIQWRLYIPRKIPLKLFAS